jgi:alkylation response protein AidB-like acyl-CoA dehydrogenase
MPSAKAGDESASRWSGTSDFRSALVEWIGDHDDLLRPGYDGHGTTQQILDHQRRVQRLLYDENWMRWGWPEAVGGLGGTALFRAVLGEELTSRGLVHTAAFSMPEVLGPAVVHFGHTELAKVAVPRLLRGDELWCQGFSEPDAGSDLGSLKTRAVEHGDEWVITGQKLWTSWAHHASRCIVLARTEEDRGSRGITAFLVDMDSPGIQVRPLDTMADVDEFCETFFDEVHVPAVRILGQRGGGWAVAQYILACERGPIFWQRGGWLLHHLGELSRLVEPDDDQAAQLLGEAYADVIALRSRSRTTQYVLAEGQRRGAESSIDKILIASADQSVFGVAREVLGGIVEFGDTSLADRYRKEWLYSRAASIYGGTAEIQRDIVAAQVLNLPRDPR